MKFSVVTASYNSAGTIAATLRSVAAQVDADFEHIVIDGASQDETLAVVAADAHDRLSVRSEPDTGIYDAMNKGLAGATGDYLLFLNSDDLLARPDALWLVAAQLERDPVDCLFADTDFISADGVRRGRRYSARNFRRWWLRIGVMPPHPSMFVRRDVLNRLGGFDESYRIGGDFDFIARALLSEGCSFTRLPLVTTLFRVGGVSTSGFRSKVQVGRETARSLRALGQPLASLAVVLRLPFKLMQFFPRFDRQASAGNSRALT